jgi:hypothetical protein
MRARTINRTALWLFYSLLAVAGICNLRRTPKMWSCLRLADSFILKLRTVSLVSHSTSSYA